ncbi:MAG TPA: hypothetical protein VMI53_05470 [Opitutaceae bacterium]|nr:hypothetical protein [Opitutaceae bacterium]
MLQKTSFIGQAELKYGVSRIRGQIGELGPILERRNWERDCLAIKYQLAALRFEIALLRRDYVSRKAGFRSDQPRWPRNSGQLGGRWSGGAGTAASGVSRAKPRSPGHHLVTKEIYLNEPFRPEVRDVFEEATIGPLRAQVHNNGEGHPEYNKAVRDAFDRFKAGNGILRSEDMTVEQARRFVDEIRGSSDPRIRLFNWRIIMRELRFYMRRGRGTE